MKYALSVLALWLPAELRSPLAQQAGDRDPAFEDVRWAYGGTAPDNPDFLYIGAAEELGAPAAPGGVWTLTAAEPDQAAGRRLALPAAGAQELYESFREAFYTLNRWVIDLDAAVMEQPSVQRLLDRSLPILRNPMVLFDASFRVVAATGNLTEQDKMLYDTVRSGAADPGTILMLQTVHRTPFYPLGDSCLYQTTTEICGVEEVFVHLHDKSGLLMARLNVCCRELPLSPALLQLLLILLVRIERVLQQQPPKSVLRALDDYLFPQLIEGRGMPEQVADVLGIPAEGEFIVLSPHMKDYDMQKTYNISAQMERIIPLSRPFLYQDQLFVLIGISSSNRSLSSYWEYQMQRVQEIRETLRLQIGISRKFTRIRAIGRACAQARAAMRLGSRKGKRPWSFAPAGRYGPDICRYDEIAIYAAVEQLMAGDAPGGVGSPVYWEMRRHDLDRGTNNCEVVKVYLQNDCEARLASLQLHMHRNSVVYRVNKLAETYALDLKDPQAKLLFLLACAADELAAEGEP